MSERNPFFGATFAERKALREDKPTTKAVDAEASEVEDKAVSSASTKKRTAKKRG